MEQPCATDGIDAVAIDGRRRAWAIAVVVLVKSRVAKTPLLFAGQPVVGDQGFILAHLKKGKDNAIGDRDRGLYAGTSLFFDFQNRRESKTSPLISSLYTLGYAYDCCTIALQYYTFNVGVRSENHFVFSFRLKGIGAFGTERFGQGLR